jgi:hypothetical protein
MHNVKGSVSWRLVSALVPAIALACRSLHGPTRTLPVASRETTADSILLERTLCYGTCSAYRLHMDRHGRVRFSSLNPGDSSRTVRDSISPEGLLFLEREAERIGFFALPETLSGTTATMRHLIDAPVS